MSIIDKNNASLYVLCPVMLHRVLVKMYPVGETYEKVEETEEQVLSRMVKSTVKVFQDITGVDTTRKKEGKVIPFEEKMRDKMMELPKAYAFPKEKDRPAERETDCTVQKTWFEKRATVCSECIAVYNGETTG